MLDFVIIYGIMLRTMEKSIIKPELVDMLFFIAERFDNFRRLELEQGKIRNELISKGYDASQVDALFDWLSQRAAKNFSSSFRRIFSQREKEVFAPDALQLLIRLARMGVINQGEVELLLVRAEIENNPVDVDEFKRMVSIIIEGGNEPFKGVFVPDNTNFVS